MSETQALPLTELGVGEHARLSATGLDEKDAQWLAAMGLAIGDEVVVLRRAPFGGPLHVRTGAGVEFAVAASIGRTLLVRRD
jgi:ferrous iron transport protein A